jgi:hypothetical protein
MQKGLTCMSVKLFKLSEPGWEKDYNTPEEARLELYNHICKICREGDKAYDKEGTLVYESDPVNEKSTIGELLSTACGCEFDVEFDV